MAAAPVIPEGFEIESQPAAAATIPDGFEIESTPQQASGDLTPPAPIAGNNPLHMPTAPVPVPRALTGPPEPPPMTFGQRVIMSPLEAVIRSGRIGDATVKNVREMGAALGQTGETNPELGGSPLQMQPGGNLTPTPQPTKEQVQQFWKATETPPVPLSAGTDPGTFSHGVAQGVESLATPQNAAILGLTMGTSGLSSGLLGVLHDALGAYFTYQMTAGATQNVVDAFHAYKQGDLDTVKDKLGAGTMQGLFAALGLGEVYRGGRLAQAIEAHNARADAQLRGEQGLGQAMAEAGGAPLHEYVAGDQLSLHPEQDGTFTVRNQSGATLFQGSREDADAFLAKRQTPPKPEPPQATTVQTEAPTTAAPGSSAGEPPEPTKPTPPTQSETVSPATPNPPTAAVPTTPESPDTIALQMEQLGKGQRKIVMIPKGTTPPALGTYPPNTRQTSDAFGNIYIYRNDLETRSAIKRAAKNNTLHELLGSADMGMAAPDKSQLPPDAPVVTSHAADGTEVQSTATDEQTLPATIEATQAVTPPGGSVSIQSPEQAIAERQETQPPAPTPVPSQDLAAPQPIEQPSAPPKPSSQTGLEQVGDMAGAITGNMYDMLWGKVQAGDVTEAGAPSAILQAAKLVRDRGGLQTPEEFRVFAQDYGAIPRDKNFQQSMRDLVARYIPAPKPEPAPQETAPAEAPQPAEDLATPQGLEQPTEKLEPQPASADPMAPPGPRWTGDRGVMPGEPAYILDQDEDGNGKAALIEVETPRGVLWEARGENGEDLGTHSFLTEAAEAAEQAYPEKPETKHELSSTQVNLSGPVAEAIKAYGRRIPRSALAEDGLEDNPHITVKFGLHADNPSALEKVLQDEGPITVTLGKTSLFQNDDADVLKIDVDSPDLHRLNQKIADALPHTDTHPDYKPHVTIAYLKKGVSQVYNGRTVPGATGQSIPFNSIVFSGKDGNESEIPLQQRPADLQAPQSIEQPATQVAKPETKAEDLAAPAPLEPPVPSTPAETAKIEASADRGARATTDERGRNEPARAEDSQALETVPAGVREEPRGQEPASSDRGTSGERPLGSVQPGDERRPGVRPGTGAGEGRLDTSPESDRVGPGDLTRESAGHDFKITDDVGVGEGTPREKVSANLEAIRTVKQIEKDGRLATPDEQRKMARYVGWGGLWQIFDWSKRDFAGAREDLRSLLTAEEYKAAEASVKNAHYTSPVVVRGMWDAMQRFGVRPGFSLIEPSMGVGNFFGMQPDSLLPARRTGVELDKITGAIAKALYPDSNVQITGFEKINLPNDFFDVAISNVPFGNFGVYDPKYKKQAVATESIHNYFFVKGLDMVRPGGIVAFITSRYTMDAQSPALRKLLASKADLVGMIRLPETAFKGNAGTEVVTDIIFLRKRSPNEAPSGPSFTDTKDVPTADGGTTRVNEYYAEHPEMMLGKLTLEGKMYAAAQQTLKGTVTPENLREAIDKLPQGIFKEWKAETPAFQGEAMVELGDAVKDGGFDVRDGVVVVRDGNLYRPAQLGKTQEARVRGMIPVRAAVRDVFATQIAEAPEKEIKAARQKLGKDYDEFVKKFGPFQSKANSLVLADDPDYPVLAALENDYDKETNTAKKAAIFTQRTIERPKPPEKADKATEALAITLNERGRLDWDRMQQLTGKTPDEIREELDGIIFQNPDGRKWETSDEYLSGNVRDKLDLARQAAAADPKFEKNVEALEKVQPRDLTPEEIKVTLGAPWVPPEAVADFLKKVLDLEGSTAHYSPLVATWSVTVPKWAQQRIANTTTYGTPDFYGHDLVDYALNGKSPRVYRDGPDDTRILDPKATQAAQAAMDALKEKFKEWIWEQPYADKLAATYNRQMNNLRLVDHDGSHLTLPGSNPAIQLRAHQKNVIWRALKTGNTLLAHEVGAGKTWEMVGIAMESRRLGLAKKPMLVVPNHMAEQVATEFAQLYPAARVLTIGKEDFASDRRKRAVARITSGAWDAVIIRHASFEKIPVSDETYQDFVNSQIEELRAALLEQKKEVGKGADKDKTVKEIQKAISRLEVKLQKHLAREKKDDAATFEQLGVDLLLVDEAHAFKNLPIITRRTRVAGIPTGESNRATDMYMKTQYVSKLNGGQRGVVFATGTPVTNTMAELYNMQRYLQPQALRDARVAHFDAWANTFGEILRGIELDVSGKGFRENERFAKFINVPELMTMYRQMADVKTAEMMKLPRPDLDGGGPQAISAPESPELTALVDSLVKRTEKIRGGNVDPAVDNMLKVVSEGKKAALDMRMIDPDAEDRPDSKVNKAVRNIYSIWKETKPESSTQIVFCDLSTPKASKKKPKARATAQEVTEGADESAVPETEGERAGFSVYDDMKAKLVNMGIPSQEIAFIHDADSDTKKQELFDAVNAGKVRVLMGSTEKMGVGTNVQKRAIALHHMDAPWRPADIKQRDGRIQRQGNQNKTVRIFQYLTEGSFDAYSWQLLENKARFIAPVLSGELTVREMEDVGMVLPSAAEFKAMASGNPLIKEKIGTDAALARLDAQRSGYRKQQAGIKTQLASLPGMIDGAQRVLSEISADVRTAEQHKDDGYTIGQQKFVGEDARKRTAEALDQALQSWRGPGNPQHIGYYQGLELWTRPFGLLDAYPGLTIRGAHSYTPNVNAENPAATLQSIESVVRNIPDRLPSWQKTLDENRKKQAELLTEQGKAWPKEAEYQKLLAKKAEVDAQLAESEAEKAAAIEGSEPALMRSMRSYEDTKANLDQTDAQYVGQTAEGEAMQKGLRRGRGRVYVNQASANLLRQIFEHLSPDRDFSDSDGFTVPAEYARKVAHLLADNTATDPRFQPLNDAFRTAYREGGAVAITVADAAVPKTKWQLKRTNYHEGIHAQQFKISARKRHLSEAALRQLFQSKLVEKAEAKLDELRYPKNAGRIIREIVCFTGSGDYAAINLTRPEALTVLEQYFEVLQNEHGNRTLAVLRSIVPDLRKELLAGYASRRSGIRGPAASTGSQGQRDLSPETSSRAGRRGDLQRSASRPPGFFSEDSGESDFSLRGLPERRKAGPGGDVQQTVSGQRSGTAPADRADVTLGSGLGAVHEPLAQLYQKDIVPTAKSISRRLHGALDDLKKVFAPQTRGPLARKGAGLIREMGSELDQRRDRAVAALEGFRQHFYRDTPQEHGVYGLSVYDSIERGKAARLSPVDQAFAQVARQLFDARKAELQELGLVKTYIDNYLPHEYKNPDEAARWIQNWQSKRPMAGSESFRKQRTYPTLREALEDPDFTLEAKFDNPVDFVLSKLGQMDKSILAHMAFEELKEAELLTYVRAGEKIPGGYAPVDDRLFTVTGPRRGAVKFDFPQPDHSQFADDEEYENALHAWEERMDAIDENISPHDVRVFGRREMGKYYAPEPLARVINNHLSPGISHSDLVKAWRAVNNTLNMIDLSVSYYHGLTTTLNSSFSDMALGLKQALHGKPIKGATSVGRGFVPFASIVHDVFLGTKIQRVWDGKEQNADPLTTAIVDALKQGGGRARQDLHYATSYTSQMLKAFAEKDNPLGAAWGTLWRAPLAALEQTMKPIMEYMVPRAKLGAFAQLAQLEIEKNPTMDLDEAREVFGRIWDSIDDRFGQLSQRNLMMHGIIRDVMNGIVGRPGWNIGTARALVGGATDALRSAADLARGRKPQVTDRTLYLLALLFGGAILNGMVNFLLTGTAPQGRDWIMPRDGGATEDGRPSRIVLPTYVAKDLYSYFTRPLATIKGKAAPFATIISDLLTNRNFQNQKIRGRGGIGYASYAKSAVTPYAVQGLQRNIERGASAGKTVLPFVGIMPAGKRAGLSKAEQIITDYQDEQRANTRPAPTDHTRARSQVFLAARRGDLNSARQLGQQAVRQGFLTPQDVQRSIQRARQTPLVNDFKTLPLNVALEVYDAATPDERKQIQAIARKKVANARAKPYEWDDESRGLASRYFGIRPPTRRGDFSAPSELQ